MGRRRESGLDALASLPWPVGIAAGVVAWFGIQYGLAWWFGSSGGLLGKSMAQQFASGAFAPVAWVLLALCWLAALISFVRARQRRRLLDAQTGLDSFASMGWRQFEQLVGEAYRRQGHVVEETGQGGADGGVDLILRKDGRTTLVQVKQWRRQKVDVRVARETYGLMVHHRADAGRIAALGGFTDDARRFAQGKAIELLDGHQLLQLVSSVQSPAAGCIEPKAPASTESSRNTGAPHCPRCNEPMVTRHNRTTSEPFWGCQRYPRCKGIRPAETKPAS